MKEEEIDITELQAKLLDEGIGTSLLERKDESWELWINGRMVKRSNSIRFLAELLIIMDKYNQFYHYVEDKR